MVSTMSLFNEMPVIEMSGPRLPYVPVIPVPVSVPVPIVTPRPLPVPVAPQIGDPRVPLPRPMADGRCA